MKTKIGHGVFGWDSYERRSGRYGSVRLGTTPFEDPRGPGFTGKPVKVVFDHSALKQFDGKRVRLTCVVVETRTSGHAGDLFLDLTPVTPETGEVVDLGVGIFTTQPGDEGPELVLNPGDGREEQWIDPRKFYRLHDQTVDVFIEETTDDFTPCANVPVKCESGIIDNGDGTLQVRKVKEGAIRVLPEVERIGDGLFTLQHPPSQRGRKIKFSQ